mgnify:CR=1 FL=1
MTSKQSKHQQPPAASQKTASENQPDSPFWPSSMRCVCGRNRIPCTGRRAATYGRPCAHLHMVAVFSAVPDLPQKAFVVSRCRRTHRAATVDRHTAGNRLFSRRGHVPDHRYHHHVDHHRTQSENRHSSRRNHACANPTDQNIICEHFSTYCQLSSARIPSMLRLILINSSIGCCHY